MTSQDDSPPTSPGMSDREPPLSLPRVRSPENITAKDTRPFSEQHFPSRRSNASLSALFASTSSGALPKRASSPAAGTPPTLNISQSAFSPPAQEVVVDDSEEYKDLLLRSFVPHVAILSAPDAEELLAGKGLSGGFLELVRPYGEQVPGKVTIRDSSGSSKSWENYAVRFTRLNDGLESSRVQEGRSTEARSQTVNGYLDHYFPSSSARLRTGGDIGFVEDAVEKHLLYSEAQNDNSQQDYFSLQQTNIRSTASSSPFHILYLRRLLSGLPLTPHETFSHPVACVIAVSSRNEDPIEELRQLYTHTTTGEQKVPPWVNSDYLRYYVLIHDEEHDDIQRSTSLFEQMKRHFGLHCHLLRLRSSRCVVSDDDCVRLPICEWISAAEEVSEIQTRENLEDFEDPQSYIFESDAAAVKGFVRELVTQSVIPVMERSRATWNDQVASKRRGINRFFSMSKKWTFGSSSRNSSSPSGSGSNYDSVQGFYRPDSPEAIMRKLADYAFMLRDFSLALTTYDLLRADFSHDKAWKYYAGANEMSAITTLMMKQPLTVKSKGDTVDQMLEAASYSYLTRCVAPFNALRTLAVGIELLQLRGGSSAEDAARWGSRILELDLVGPVGHALYAQRVAASFASRKGNGSHHWGSRRRKAGIWNMLTSQAWLHQDKAQQAQQSLSECFKAYQISPKNMNHLVFEEMQNVLLDLRDAVSVKRGAIETLEDVENIDEQKVQDTRTLIEEETEKLDIRSHQRSLSTASSGSTNLFDKEPNNNTPQPSELRLPTEALALDAGKVDIRQHRKSLIGMSTAPSHPLQEDWKESARGGNE